MTQQDLTSELRPQDPTGQGSGCQKRSRLVWEVNMVADFALLSTLANKGNELVWDWTIERAG